MIYDSTYRYYIHSFPSFIMFTTLPVYINNLKDHITILIRKQMKISYNVEDNIVNNVRVNLHCNLSPCY